MVLEPSDRNRCNAPVWGECGGCCGWGVPPGTDSLDAMTHTANAQLTDVSDMFIVHRAFRREFGLLPQLVRRVAGMKWLREKEMEGTTRSVLDRLGNAHLVGV